MFERNRVPGDAETNTECDNRGKKESSACFRPDAVVFRRCLNVSLFAAHVRNESLSIVGNVIVIVE